MSYLSYIALPQRTQRQCPIEDLGETHGINARSVQMYKRFYGLQDVTQNEQPLDDMLSDALVGVLAKLPDAGETAGHLVYCKTQTHNTFSSDNWLRGFADRRGLAQWEVSTPSMTSCASALVQMHIAQELATPNTSLIILTGEKTFHPWVSRLPVGLLAEIPAAALFNAGQGSWRVVGSTVRHLTRFHENPNAMAADERRALQEVYTDQLVAFVEKSLQAYGDAVSDDMIFLPHNLNQPVTQTLLTHFGWYNRHFQGDIAHAGHGFCSDIFLNGAVTLIY
jgi:hypothetical protein